MQKFSNGFIEQFCITPYQNGSLNNLTFAVKDCIDIRGMVSGFGNPTWKNTHFKTQANAICVDQLLSDGATCIGKTTMDEFAYGLLGENYFYGMPVNYKYPNRVPGGSSSGSASIVAAGLADFALGTDTGGSIRVPANNCGIYGYRPSYGLISTAGVIPLSPSLDTVGVLAKDFKTLHLVAYNLTGMKSNLSYTNSQPRILIIEDILNVLDIHTKYAFSNHLKNHIRNYELIKLADIFKLSITLELLFESYVIIHSSEIWNTLGAWITRTSQENLGIIPKYNIENIVKPIDRKQLLDVIKLRQSLSENINRFLIENNALLCFPTVPEIAPLRTSEILQPEKRNSSNYFQNLIATNAIASICRLPQISIPIDYKNMPMSISFISHHNNDQALFNLENSV